MSKSENDKIVEAYFTDGYSARNVLGFYRQVCHRANILFTPTSIIIKEEDTNETILVDCNINTGDLTYYKYNAVDKEGKPLEALMCGFNTMDMQKATRIVGKKDGMRLYTKAEKNPKIYIQVIHTKSDEDVGLRIIPIIDVPFEPYAEIVYEREIPNAKASCTDFAKKCADFSTQKCNKTVFIGYDGGVAMKGYESDIMKCLEKLGITPGLDKLISSERYGISPDVIDSKKPKPKLKIEDIEEITKITVNAKIVRAMTKLNNLSEKGTVKFFMEKGMPLKIISHIGCYGTFTLYIKNAE